MRGKHFMDVDTIKRETTKLLEGLIKEDMQHWFQEWKKRERKVEEEEEGSGRRENTLRVTTSPFQNNLIWIFGEPSARIFCTHLVWYKFKFIK